MLKRAIIAAACLSASLPALADEGMWTFDNFPYGRLRHAHGVTIDHTLLRTMMSATVRLSSQCSAAVVSPEGLILTNHHCADACVQQLSTPQTDYLKDGFLTTSRADEKACPGLHADILQTIIDISAWQRGDATKGGTAETARHTKDALEGVEALCDDRARYRCDTVELYSGGQVKLHVYRKYTDVRLVFAPEVSVASFGGDPDNFNFPRHSLDALFLRLYADGKPAATPQHLKWVARAPKVDEVTFLPGNPGYTYRLETVAQLENNRDLVLPHNLLLRSELRGRLIRFAQENAENRRLVASALSHLENGFKVNSGRRLALTNRAFMDHKRASEVELRARVATSPALLEQLGDPWGEIAEIQRIYAENYIRYYQLESAAGAGSVLFDYARDLVRAAKQREKPDADRMSRYKSRSLSLLEQQLLVEQSVPLPLEQLYLEFWLAKTREYLTTSDPDTKLILDKESPEELAARLVAGTKLADPAVRKALWEGGLKAIEASDDPLVKFALKIDPPAVEIAQVIRTKVTDPENSAAVRVAYANYIALGAASYPDATFSPRISFGKVAGWTHAGRTVPAYTTIGELYDRATGAEPYKLAPRWAAAKDKLELSTVFDFVATNDATGGNSGSALVSADGEVLGTAFDLNIHALGGDYAYEGTSGRVVVTSSAAITEVLGKVYGLYNLLDELGAP